MNQKTRRMLWFILPLVVFLLAIGLFYSRLGKDTQVVTNTAVDKTLPTMNLPALDLDEAIGQATRMVTNADLPKQPFLLNVWASWCATCRVEHPFLLQLANAGVPIVGINYKDDAKDAQAYLAEHQNPFTLNVQDSGDYGIDLGLTGVPESFVVDSRGEVRQHIIGEVNAERYQRQVLPCLTALREQRDERAIIEACQP
ncbi:DsbE family thiol:disulfide interchange protein [Moraxella atlantae]|uniref:Cytochrome c biogenesis protein CcmG n=1 Tax=Faucicola atlantae TaxID=34059 RepID=A0A378Q7T0_9GAMM|nr:DsbE family thiol:disulfide interchange protein [Moraxella atlantae]OPH37368.1 thiol:disulfide interchange protein [Moraxella atlantae]STY95277.1 Cytochrome c biogenesis protein CcmG [Moraxella atlantae]